MLKTKARNVSKVIDRCAERSAAYQRLLGIRHLALRGILIPDFIDQSINFYKIYSTVDTQQSVLRTDLSPLTHS